MYTITVSDDELDLIRLTLGRAVPAKKVRRAAVKVPVETFAPDTGDSALDAFMRRSHTPENVKLFDRHLAAGRRAAGIGARKKFPHGNKAMTKQHREQARDFADLALAEWRRRGYTIRIEPIPTVHGLRIEATIDWRNVRILPPEKTT